MVELLFVGGTADSGGISIVAAMKRASTSTSCLISCVVTMAFPSAGQGYDERKTTAPVAARFSR
jgi:hypothetical protein